MSAYYGLDISLSPYSEDAADLLAAFLADEGFESFESTPQGLKAYIKVDLFDEEKVSDIVSSFPMEVEISWGKDYIEHTDWNEEWEKKYFKPLVLGGGRCVVHSSFHTGFPEAEYDIVIDPKMAFGTGHHATTTMMVNHLFRYNPAGKRVMDMGSGTGILAILAHKLGAKNTIAIEIDPGAHENAIENCAVNNAAVDMRLGDAEALKDVRDIDIFLANINRNIILADLDRYVATMSKGAKLILSGFYLKDIPLLKAALYSQGLSILETASEGEDWASIVAVKD